MDNSIIIRIQKLLALAHGAGATEAEANLAMEKAHAIMAEHNLTMATIAATKKEEGEKRDKAGLDGQAMFDYQRDLMAVIAETNYCYAQILYKYTKRGRKGAGYTLIGTQSNVATAKAMFEYLMQTINRLVMDEIDNDYRKRMSRWAISWCTGCADRLRERIRDRHETYLREQKKKAEEAARASRHPASPSHGALVVVMEDYAQREADLNNDMKRGWEPGTTTANRLKRKEEKSRRFTAAKEAGYDDQVAGAYSEQHFETFQAAFDWCYPSEEKQKENDKWWDRHDRREERRREQAFAKRDWSAHRKGSEAGSKIGLDAQIDKSAGLKSIK